MSPIPTFRLNNGVELPAVGFGTWGGLTEEGRKAVKDIIVSALKARRYRRIA
jgi:diketogulonate reductase-like aldo/keto reductase